jgi:hypothetical protein
MTAVIEDFAALVIEQNSKPGMSTQERKFTRYSRDLVNIATGALLSGDEDESLALINALALVFAM